MYQLVFYVPEPQAEEVKEAVFKAGGGHYKNYSHCCWQTVGTGQFKPLEESNPFIGKKGSIEHVSEYKVELIVRDELIEAVVQTLKSAHPYEEPAYSVIRLEDF